MKQIIFTIAFLLTSIYGYAEGTESAFDQNRRLIGGVFEQYRATEDVKVIEIGAAMIRMLATNQFEQGNDEVARLLRSISSIDILVAEGGDSQLREELFSLPKRCREYELITAIDNGGGVVSRFYIASHSPKCEFLMLVDKGDNLIMLTIVGEFSVADISTLSALSGAISNQ
ncbi:MAG: DUF4252 domain-containing protein [Rikenellaceae bacterium]